MSGVLSRNSLEHAVAGTTGSMLATLLLFPLERLKTLLQLELRKDVGLLHILRRVLKEEGPAGLYRGCTPMLQTVGVSNFIYFFLFEGLKEPLANAAGRPEGEVGPYETLVSSAISGAINMSLTEPFWRACVVAQARTRPGLTSISADGGTGGSSDLLLTPSLAEPLASPRSVRSSRLLRQQTLGSVGVFHTVYHLWVAEGARALWRGLPSSLWLVMNPVIQFFVYDLLKAMLRSVDDISSAEAFAMGAVAKALATVATFPLQVAQSRLRAAREAVVGATVKELALQPRPELQGMVPCLMALLREGGLNALYSGLFPKLVQTVTQTACMFAFYEKIHWVIRRFSKRTRRIARRMSALRRQ